MFNTMKNNIIMKRGYINIKENNENMIVLLARAPAPEFEKIYLDAGIDEFIHVRANCYNILTWLQSKGGIK